MSFIFIIKLVVLIIGVVILGISCIKVITGCKEMDEEFEEKCRHHHK